MGSIVSSTISDENILTPISSPTKKKRKQSEPIVTYDLIKIADVDDVTSYTETLLKRLKHICALDDGFIRNITSGWDFVVIQKVVNQHGKKIISGIAVADNYMTHDSNGGLKHTGVELLALCVSKKIQRLGLGKKLLKYFEEHCFQINAREVFAYSVPDMIWWYSAQGYNLTKPDVLIIGDKKVPTDAAVLKFKSFLSQEKWPVLTNETREGRDLMDILNKQGFIKKDVGRTIQSRTANGVLMTKELIPVADFKPNDTKGFKMERKAPLDRSSKRVKT